MDALERLVRIDDMAIAMSEPEKASQFKMNIAEQAFGAGSDELMKYAMALAGMKGSGR